MGGQLDVVGWEQRKGSGELAAAVHLCMFYFLFPVCMSVSIVFPFPAFGVDDDGTPEKAATSGTLT